MLAAIRREPVDHVPFSTYNLSPVGENRHTRDDSYRELLELVAAKSAVLSKMAAQGGVREPEGLSEKHVAQTDEGKVTTTTLHTPKGDLKSVMVRPTDQPAYVTEHYIKTDEDVARYMSIPYEPADSDLSRAIALYDAVGEGGLVYVAYPDPMYSAGRLFDYEDFVVRCFTDLDNVLVLIDHIFEREREQVRGLADAAKGRDFLMYTAGPEAACPPMMRPEIFSRIVTPYHTELVNIFHDAGILVSMHCHGRVRDVLGEAIKCGFDVIEPIEPPPQGDITLAELMQEADGRIALMGHVQDQELHYAEPGHFTRLVEHLANVVDGRTGYLCTPTCTPFQYPATEVYLRNYAEWIEAADRFFAGEAQST